MIDTCVCCGKPIPEGRQICPTCADTPKHHTVGRAKPITKEKAIDILERFYCFQGQRAGRELWNDKPFDVQEKDLEDFSRDCQLLIEYVKGQ